VFEFFIVVDRGTSRLVYLEAREGYNAVTALEAVARLLLLHGLPQRLRVRFFWGIPDDSLLTS
jgi:hypothetical protein